jgi:hypothetical protein
MKESDKIGDGTMPMTAMNESKINQANAFILGQHRE